MLRGCPRGRFVASPFGSPQRFARKARHSCVRTAASWQDDLPRIVDDIPRRIRGGSGSLLDYGHKGQDAVQWAIKQVTSLISPVASSIEATQRTDIRWWPYLLGTALVLALCYEVFLAGVLLRNFVLRRPGGASESEAGEGLDLPEEWQLPNTPEIKSALKDERSRGVAWLVVATALAVWVSGIFDSAAPLRP